MKPEMDTNYLFEPTKRKRQKGQRRPGTANKKAQGLAMRDLQELLRAHPELAKAVRANAEARAAAKLEEAA